MDERDGVLGSGTRIGGRRLDLERRLVDFGRRRGPHDEVAIADEQRPGDALFGDAPRRDERGGVGRMDDPDDRPLAPGLAARLRDDGGQARMRVAQT